MSFVSGWYKLTFNGRLYLYKEDPTFTFEAKWEDVPVAGIEGDRIDCVFSGASCMFDVDIYDTSTTGVVQAADAFQDIKQHLVRHAAGGAYPEYGDLASGAVTGAKAWAIGLVNGVGGIQTLSNTAYGKALPTVIDHEGTNQFGHHATVNFECYNVTL